MLAGSPAPEQFIVNSCLLHPVFMRDRHARAMNSTFIARPTAASSASDRFAPSATPATHRASPAPLATQVSKHAAPRPSAQWAAHFRSSRARDWRIPWDAASPLGENERARVASSIAEFQRGGSSEADRYLRLSSLFSLRHRDAAFHEASVLFVREETEHAALLLRFMNGASIPSRGTVFSDVVFRRLRAFGDLAWSSRVLLVAELVAQEYYPCLRKATTQPALRRLCDKLICDEFAHVRFHIERIAKLEAALSPAQRRLREHLQGALLAGTALAVYRSHRPVLTSLGATAFFRRLLRRFRRASRAIRALSRDCVADEPAFEADHGRHA